MNIEDIKKYCLSHKKIFCYGAGLYGRVVRIYLEEHGIDIDGFIVSSKKDNCKETVLHAPVYSVDTISGDRPHDFGILLCVGSESAREIILELNERQIYDYICIDEKTFVEMRERSEYKKVYSSDYNITVFCYHRVADIPMDTWRLACKPQLFEEHIKYIKSNYKVIKADDEWAVGREEKAAIITFDDGYEDAYTNVLPILEKYRVPGTVFVCSGNINNDKEFWWDELERIVFSGEIGEYEFTLFGENIKIKGDGNREEICYKLHPYLKRMNFNERTDLLEYWGSKISEINKRDYCRSMSEAQLCKLSKSPFISIGGHTVTHSCLKNETHEEQEWEILQSKRDIEAIIGKTINVFSYPFGQKTDFSEETVAIAEESGYSKIFAAFSGLTSLKCTNGYIPRINIGQERNYKDSIRMLRYYESIYANDWV